MAHINLELMII